MLYVKKESTELKTSALGKIQTVFEFIAFFELLFCICDSKLHLRLAWISKSVV